jgi:hypothetical protein
MYVWTLYHPYFKGISANIELQPPYYKMWSKDSLGLILRLSLLFAKKVTVTVLVLNQD